MCGDHAWLSLLCVFLCVSVSSVDWKTSKVKRAQSCLSLPPFLLPSWPIVSLRLIDSGHGCCYGNAGSNGGHGAHLNLDSRLPHAQQAVPMVPCWWGTVPWALLHLSLQPYLWGGKFLNTQCSSSINLGHRNIMLPARKPS